jgi:predicted peptidase
MSGREELFEMLNVLQPQSTIRLEVVRKDGKKSEIVSVQLAVMPGATASDKAAIPGNLPPEASLKKALEPLQVAPGQPKQAKAEHADGKAETGFLKRTTAGGDHKYWLYVHDDYDPNIAHALVVWLHAPQGNTDDDIERFTGMWEDYCKDNHIILVGPQSESESGWTPSEADFVQTAVREVMARYTIDPQRVVAHGTGIGGQMACYLGFNARELFHGVATVGAVVTNPKDNVPGQRLSFYLAGGDRDPLIKAITESRTKLTERKIPVYYHELANRGREYLEDLVLAELVRWIDSLDKQ